MSTIRRLATALSLLVLGTGCGPGALRSSIPPTGTLIPATVAASLDTPIKTPTAVSPTLPDNLISLDSLLGYLEELTNIHPYAGWRNSGSSGEAAALDMVVGKLGEFSTLKSRGLELERQVFDVYLSTEIRATRLTLMINNQEIEVDANGLRGSRLNRVLAAYFDSDGKLSDSNPDPMTAGGAPLVVRDEEALYSLAAEELAGRILFLDYSLIDIVTNNDPYTNGSQLRSLIDRGLVGVVLVTQYSNTVGESRGSFVGDGSIFRYDVPTRRVPILYVHMEDLSPAGIATWEDFQRIDAARLMLDADVLCPGKAGNLIARIPGADNSRAVILGAHIDSPNGPGAFDDGSGAAALLEVARVLDVSQIQPGVDIYLAWFGGHEIGTYGSAYFASTHQALLDRTLAMVQMDGLGHPLDGRNSEITMFSTTYGRFGEERQPLPDFLSQAVAAQGISLDRLVEYGLIADNSNFDVFNIPNVYLGYSNAEDWKMKGSDYFHYANHYHDSYETADLAREVGEAFIGMTKVMLTAALETGRLQPDLRVTPAATRRALFIASHNESVSMTTAMLRELGMALAWEGFDVDLIPCGQPITPVDLENVGIVVLAPTLDYPGNYETWSENELALLESYVFNGGFLVVTNSEYNHITVRPVDKHNEDARALNGLLEPMGIKFMVGGGMYDANSAIALAVNDHDLTVNATYLSFYNDNGVPFSMNTGLELFRAAGMPIVGLVDSGEQGGQILVVADIGILQADQNFVKNLDFLKNIAHYAKTRGSS